MATINPMIDASLTSSSSSLAESVSTSNEALNTMAAPPMATAHEVLEVVQALADHHPVPDVASATAPEPVTPSPPTTVAELGPFWLMSEWNQEVHGAAMWSAIDAAAEAAMAASMAAASTGPSDPRFVITVEPDSDDEDMAIDDEGELELSAFNNGFARRSTGDFLHFCTIRFDNRSDNGPYMTVPADSRCTDCGRWTPGEWLFR